MTSVIRSLMPQKVARCGTVKYPSVPQTSQISFLLSSLTSTLFFSGVRVVGNLATRLLYLLLAMSVLSYLTIVATPGSQPGGHSHE